MSKKHKKVYRVLNYTEHLLILIYTVAGCISISAFASFVGIPIRITSSAIGLKTCVITAVIKKDKSIIKKKKKKHYKIFSLVKSRLNSVGVLISNALIHANISHEEFVLINNVSKEFEDIKEGKKNSRDK